MITIRTKNLSKLFFHVLSFRKFLKSLNNVGIVISPEDGVDWEISGSIPEKTKVYSLLPKTKEVKTIIDSQKLAIGYFNITPIVFFGSLDYEEIKGYTEIGLYGISGVDDIKEFEEKSERKPDFIRISINPLKYPKEIINYCRTNNIKIMATDVFGSDILREYYKKLFPETFLQAFGEYNSSILEIPGDDPYFIKDVYSRYGKTPTESTKLLEYSKDVDKVPSLKIPGKKIHQYLDIEVKDLGDLMIESDTGKFSLKPIEEKFNIGEPIWEDDLIPGDIDTSDKKLMGVLHRYHVLPKLSEMYSSTIWKPVFTKIYSDFWAIKMIPKSWLGWFWKEHYYWLISGKLWKIPLSKHEILING